ncbi:hypothetical protein UlMin_021485 [Ulmus minor]
MHEGDQEHTAFLTNQGLYCYKVMPFGLKNAGATYQRLVNKMFKDQIGKTMEVYVDDMLVKSLKTEEHIQNLRETFEILRRYKMKLNPSKCAFGVSSGKFLGFMVNHRGIEANPAKIQALLDMEPPRKIKEVQRLTGRIAALNRFISRATDHCKPFFQALHSLILYLAVSKGAVSSTLVREEDGVQWPIYYTSKSLLDAETRYPEIEKLALALMVAARKLRPYFQAHTIIIPTKFPLKQVFQKPEASGRLAKWSIELGEFDIQFKPRTAIKGQALADFIAEFTYAPEMSEKLTTQTQNSQWKLYVDGSSTETSSGAGIILVSPDGVKLSCAVRFKFKATNNQAEYEALLSGLRLAKEVSARHLTIYSDSQLVVSQVNSEFQAKGEKMASYLEKAKEAMNQFDTVTIIQVPRAENTNADALARLATGLEERLLKTVPIEILEAPSIDKKEQVGSIVVRPCWMDPIISFLRDGTLPADKFEARRLRFRSAPFIWKNIVCRFGVPRELVSDHGTQFENEKLQSICDRLGIKKVFSSLAHPKSNGQVEAVNKTIKQTLKKKLEKSKGAWVDELPLVLWAYRTSFRAATGETPFSLAYGVEAVIPIEISLPTFRVDNFDEESNAVLLALATNLLEEKREISQVRAAALQQTIARYYNSKVKLRRFVKGDLVLRKVFLNTKDKGVGVLGPNWEGPYRVRAIIRPGTYELETLEGRVLGNPWNAEHLRRYFQ